jgi:ribosomal protein S18 acetylase RimI-like enzyme
MWYDESGDEDERWFPPSYMKKWIQNPRDDVLLVARIDGKLAGMCLTYVVHNWALISELFVAAEFRGQGVGKALVNDTCKRLKKQKIRIAELFVNVNNNEALKFYKKMQFTGRNQFYALSKHIE